jgi:hypothetical protein
MTIVNIFFFSLKKCKGWASNRPNKKHGSMPVMKEA